MINHNQVHFVQDHLAAEQSPVNEKVYKDKFGLFLQNDQVSELEAITSCDSHESSGDVLTPVPHCKQQSLLTSVREIQAFFGHERKGLVMLHIGHLQHSYSRLKITQACFDQLLESAGIYHALKDNILHVGYRTMEIEIAPPPPSLRFLYDVDRENSPICGLEMAYGLRFIEANGRDNGNPWSLRQCVIYNKTDHTKDLSQWVFFCLPKILRAQVDHCLDTFQQDLVLQPFNIHLMVIATAISMWRPYFVHLAQEIELCKNQVNMSDPRSHASVKNVHETTFLILKDYESDLLDAMLAIQATKRTLAHHQSLWQKWCASQQSCTGQSRTTSFDLRFSAMFQNLDGALDQAQSFLEKVRSISGIIASFLALASSYSAENTAEQSVCVAELSRVDSSMMKIMAGNTQRDTKAVKALSVITLIYLPITVVLNFFSTPFVTEDHGNVQIIGRWWLLIATGVPLTILTLIAWVIWIYRQSRRLSSTDPEVGHAPDTPQSNSDTQPRTPVKV